MIPTQPQESPLARRAAACLAAAAALCPAARARAADGDNPIVFTLYTVHRGVLKLSVQMIKLPDDTADRTVHLEVRPDAALDEIKKQGRWRQIATAEIVQPGWVATFRVKDWDVTKNVHFQVRYAGRWTWRGVIRRDPPDKDEIVVAAFTGNVQNPAANMKEDVVEYVGKFDPDLLVFTGDQTYNHGDHHWGWTTFGREFGQLMRWRPTVTIPDDHDVGQGNLWGAGGRATTDINAGGYSKPPAYVNEVQRCQTSHLPDPHDPTPVEQGISVYYTSLNVGGIDFAILEDRKFKSGYKGLVSEDDKDLDPPGTTLLGERQLKFLRHWAGDWRGAEMKAVISQTPFSSTTNYTSRGKTYMKADFDSNGWPKRGRDRALREIRKAFAIHICGDTHLAALVQYGVDDWNDAGWAFVVPAVWNSWPRWWDPKAPGKDREPGAPPYTGKFLDAFGNPLTVYGVANPGKIGQGKSPPPGARSEGFGILRFHKKRRTITVECWPRFVDPGDPANATRQYDGWPRTIHQLANYGRPAAACLPTLNVTGMRNPVIQVIREDTKEVVYTLRIAGSTFRPKVFAKGTYTLKVGEPGTRRHKTLTGLASLPLDATKTLTVDLE